MGQIYRMAFLVGPCWIAELGRKVEATGLRVGVGTEHLWIDAEGADLLDATVKVQETVKATHGTDLGIGLRTRTAWRSL